MIIEINCEICGYKGRVVGMVTCPCPHPAPADEVADGQTVLAVDDA